MIKIEYPAKKPMVKTEDGREIIFCMIRKRWLLITPEEWVRQNFLLYLTLSLGYPASLIAVEKQLMLGDVMKRFDIVVYDNTGKAHILIECKEMNIPLTENVLQQVLGYNINVQANLLVITNGSYCCAFEKRQSEFTIAESLPPYKKWSA